MIHILQIMVGTGSYGGAEQFALSYYENMDKSKIQYDFLFLYQNVLKTIDNPCLNGSKIEELGTWNKENIYRGCVKTIKELIKFLKKNKYEIVHINSGVIKVEMCCLFAAKIAGVKIRIAHSHTSKPISENVKESVSEKIKSAIIRYLATDYFACSKAAGLYLFGEKGIKSEKFRIVTNAVNLDKYKYNIERNIYIRKREGIVNGLIFGHVGRFVDVKNHPYLIDIFKKIHDRLPEAQLWLIGDGELFTKVQNYIDTCGLSKSVRLFGERNDVADLMQAMDALIFPSKFEGLSMVVVESQAAGLNVFASDSISKKHKLSDHIWFLSLDSGVENWSDFIIEKMKNYEKTTNVQDLIDNGYDINIAAKELENYYLSRTGKENAK